MDAEGRPHGFGWRAFAGAEQEKPASVFYRGDWLHGRRSGQGALRDEDTGALLYEGGWEADQRHGRGMEKLDHEEFDGFFEDDSRHGFGNLRYTGRVGKNRGGGRKREPGECFSGFWKAGARHGLGRWTFPPSCRSLHLERPDALLPLGKIGCIAAHRDGSLLREFFFHRVDGQELTTEDRGLLQECASSISRTAAMTKAGAFASNPHGRWPNCDVCWVCADGLRRAASVACPNCDLRVHATCAAKMQVGGPEDVCPMPTCRQEGRKLALLDERVLEDVLLRGGGNSYQDLVLKHASATLSALLPSKRMSTHSAKQVLKRFKPGAASSGGADAAENSEARRAVLLARKLARRAKKGRVDAHTKFFQGRLRVHRNKEVRRRRKWRAQLLERHQHRDELESRLNSAQGGLVHKQLRLSRLHGRDLKGLRLDELTALQTSVETALDRCRLALERTMMMSAGA